MHEFKYLHMHKCIYIPSYTFLCIHICTYIHTYRSPLAVSACQLSSTPRANSENPTESKEQADGGREDSRQNQTHSVHNGKERANVRDEDEDLVGKERANAGDEDEDLAGDDDQAPAESGSVQHYEPSPCHR